jgi:hypothetical protein
MVKSKPADRLKHFYTSIRFWGAGYCRLHLPIAVYHSAPSASFFLLDFLFPHSPKSIPHAPGISPGADALLFHNNNQQQ